MHRSTPTFYFFRAHCVLHIVLDARVVTVDRIAVALVFTPFLPDWYSVVWRLATFWYHESQRFQMSDGRAIRRGVCTFGS